jgi:uncharacterized membrane protein YjgN (DUF898 family)
MDETVMTPAAPPGLALHHDGRAGELFGIFLINVVLSILTLGIYSFWGKTRLRRYMWSQTNLADEPLEYTGTGGELFKSFLFVFFVILLPLGLVFIVISVVVGMVHPEYQDVANIPFYLVFLFLIGIAQYRALNYRLSRSQWRGIRGGLGGSTWDYAVAAFAYRVLTFASLGLAAPLLHVRLANLAYDNIWLGDRKIEFEAHAQTIYRTYLIAWLLALPTLFLSILWYHVTLYRYFASRFQWGGLRFRFTASTGQLIGLVVPNLLIMLVTLTLGRPLVWLRSVRFICRHIEIDGAADFAAIAQSEQRAPVSGEGLLDALDLDSF